MRSWDATPAFLLDCAASLAMTASPRTASGREVAPGRESLWRQCILEAACVAAVILPERLWAYDGGRIMAVPPVCALITAALP